MRRRGGMCGAGLGLALMVALSGPALRAGEPARIESRLSEGRLLQFLAVGVRALAVGDAQRHLAVAFAAGRPQAACLLALNPRGDFATGEPIPLPLPEVGGLKGVTGEPVAVQFHPREPLLYLWRRRGAAAAKVEPFDHLVVFDVSNPQSIGVVTTACSGVAFQSELLPSALALDARARRLYLPNLQVLNSDGKTFATALGYLTLDAQGLPAVKRGGELALTLAPTGEASRRAAGFGSVAMGDRILLTVGWRGVLYWDTNNRLAAMNGFAFSELSRDDVMLTANERWIYTVTIGMGGLACIRHVNGYPTLMPESFGVAGVNFQSPPVLMGGQAPALAIAGKDQLTIVGLTPEGSFSREHQVFKMAWLPERTPLAYSARADRLYIPVEGWP